MGLKSVSYSSAPSQAATSRAFGMVALMPTICKPLGSLPRCTAAAWCCFNLSFVKSSSRRYPRSSSPTCSRALSHLHAV